MSDEPLNDDRGTFAHGCVHVGYAMRVCSHGTSCRFCHGARCTDEDAVNQRAQHAPPGRPMDDLARYLAALEMVRDGVHRDDCEPRQTFATRGCDCAYRTARDALSCSKACEAHPTKPCVLRGGHARHQCALHWFASTMPEVSLESAAWVSPSMIRLMAVVEIATLDEIGIERLPSAVAAVIRRRMAVLREKLLKPGDGAP